MTMNKTWLAAIAIALASATQVQAQTFLPYANNCVSVSSAPDGGSSSGDWSPRYRATNSCPETVTITYRHNYGLSYEGTISCSGGSAFNLRPGASYTFDAGPLPKGVTSRIRWCAQYDDYDHQEMSGYETCYQSDLPSCPPLY